MDGITRKRMQCDSHIAKIGYFGWKKIGEALGKGKGLYNGILQFFPKIKHVPHLPQYKVQVRGVVTHCVATLHDS